ncbi:hypothetical protein QN277_025114 [Acacia crassicarpa]|uniref:Retrotransposon Copia-like N-terminal domain-containing protein n=1 Tax=Acacia crassicarpa TaxID=499986 RepID=A0AAE1K8S1_9FABA|nr:hypothetical protein QN277_025114 [Acacia crassicarpa]
MSTSSTDSGSSSQTRTYTLFSSFGQTAVTKLDRTNFLIWESIVLPLIEGNRLQGHINGTSKALPKMISGSTGTRTEIGARLSANPAWSKWFSIDRLLVEWLRNTMTQDIGAQLLHFQTIKALWTEAREFTSASTRAHIMVVKNELHNTQKNSLTMEAYLNKMKSLSDELTLAGFPIAMDDLILHMLDGPDSEYNAIVVKLVFCIVSRFD